MSQREFVPTARWPAVALACAILALFGLMLCQYFAFPLGHDQASYLFEAERMLSGATPYGPHLSETNPPIIIFFSALPVLLAKVLPGSSILWFRVLVVSMGLGSVAWCFSILRRGLSWLSPFLLVLFSGALLLIENRMIPDDFGQREHLMIILLLPYVLAVSTGAISRVSMAECCSVGIAAGVAIWLKPQDTIVLVVLELFLAASTRSLRRLRAPEFLGLVTTSLLLLAVVRIATPMYFSVTYPLLADTYWAIGTYTTLGLAFGQHHGYICFVAVLLLAVLLCRRHLRDFQGALALILCSIGAWVACDVQHTDWIYHAFPQVVLARVALVYLLIDLLTPLFYSILRTPRIFYPMTAFMLFILAAVSGAQLDRYLHSGVTFPKDPEEETFFDTLKPQTSVYVFSTNVLNLGRVYRHHLIWGSRFAHLWMMPAIVQNVLGPQSPSAPFKRLSPQRLQYLENLQRSESAEDLNYFQPSIVLIEHCTTQHPCLGFGKRDFDMLSWFEQSPAFVAAWSHYQQQPGIPNFDVYRRTR